MSFQIKNQFKRLFKLTNNIGWARKVAEVEAQEESVQPKGGNISIPTVKDFLGYLEEETDRDSTEESDVKQIALDHAVGKALGAFLAESVDGSSLALNTWRFGDVLTSLSKELVTFDDDDLKEIQNSALPELGEDADLKAVVSDKEKLQDAIKLALTRAYLHAYTVMVSKNPVVFLLTTLESLSGHELPLSLQVGLTKMAVEDVEDDDTAVKALKTLLADSSRGPRLSDWIRSLKINRAKISLSLQKVTARKKKDPTLESKLRMQFLSVDANITHLENMAQAWRDLVGDRDEYKGTRLGDTYMMDDPPIANMLSSNVENLSSVMGFLPSPIFTKYGISPQDFHVKKWDGTVFSKLRSRDSEVVTQEYVTEMVRTVKSAVNTLNDFISKAPLDVQDSNVFKQLVRESKKFELSLTQLHNYSQLASKRGPPRDLFATLVDDVSVVSALVSDLSKMAPGMSSRKLVGMLANINQAIPRGREDELSFTPPARFIQNNYLPTVAKDEAVSKRWTLNYVEDMIELMDFHKTEKPAKLSSVYNVDLNSEYGIRFDEISKMTEEMYSKAYGAIYAYLTSVPVEKLRKYSDEQLVAFISGLAPIRNKIRDEVISQYSQGKPATTLIEVFDKVCETLPSFGDKNHTNVAALFGGVRSSDILARSIEGKTHRQVFLNMYSSQFLTDKESGIEDASAVAAAKRLTDNHFYSFYDQHVAKEAIWNDNYGTLGYSEQAQAARSKKIREQMAITDFGFIKDLGLPQDSGFNVFMNRNTKVPASKDQDRQDFLGTIQGFLSDHPTMDALYQKVESSNAPLSTEALLQFVGTEMIAAFHDELVIYIANCYPKTNIIGVKDGLSKNEVGKEEMVGAEEGSSDEFIDRFSYQHIGKGILAVDQAEKFVDEFSKTIRFNSREIGQLHPYSPGGMVADLYYMADRIPKLPNQEGRIRRTEDLKRILSKPTSLLGYMKKRLADAYGKVIYDRNQEQLLRVIFAQRRLGKKENAGNLYEFMEACGAFADPLWSLVPGAAKDNYRYLTSEGDSAHAHMLRAFSAVGQISGNERNYGTFLSIYKNYFDNKKKELLALRDSEGKALWAPFIVPFSTQDVDMTNRPFWGRLPLLLEVQKKLAAFEVKKTPKQLREEEEFGAPQQIGAEDQEMVSLLIKDKKSALEAIDSLPSSMLSNLDKSMIKEQVIMMGTRTPEVYKNGKLFIAKLVEQINRDKTFPNRIFITDYLQGYVSVQIDQVESVKQVLVEIVAEEKPSNQAEEIKALVMKGQLLTNQTIPTGLRKYEYAKQKTEFLLQDMESWKKSFEDLSIRANLDEQYGVLNNIKSYGMDLKKLKNEFDQLSASDRKELKVNTLARYLGYALTFIENGISNEYSTVRVFLENQEEYFAEEPDALEALDDNTRIFVDLKPELVADAEKLQEVSDAVESFRTILASKLDELNQMPEAEKSAVDEWKSSLDKVVNNYKETLLKGKEQELDELAKPEEEKGPDQVEEDEFVMQDVAPDASEEDLPEASDEDVSEEPSDENTIFEGLPEQEDEESDMTQAPEAPEAPADEATQAPEEDPEAEAPKEVSEFEEIAPEEDEATQLPEDVEDEADISTEDLPEGDEDAPDTIQDGDIVEDSDADPSFEDQRLDQFRDEATYVIPSLKKLSLDFENFAKSKDLGVWLNANASAQRLELVGNMLNLADAISKITQEQLTSSFAKSAEGQGKSPEKMIQDLQTILNRCRSDLKMVSQIFTDATIKQLVGKVKTMFNIELVEMPLARSRVQTVQLDLSQVVAAANVVKARVEKVEGSLTDLVKAENVLDQLFGPELSSEEEQTIIANTKIFLRFIQNLNSKDFANQAGVDSLRDLLKKMVLVSDKEFALFFSGPRFTRFLAALPKLGVTKTAMQQLKAKIATHYEVEISTATDHYVF